MAEHLEQAVTGLVVEKHCISAIHLPFKPNFNLMVMEDEMSSDHQIYYNSDLFMEAHSHQCEEKRDPVSHYNEKPYIYLDQLDWDQKWNII